MAWDGKIPFGKYSGDLCDYPLGNSFQNWRRAQYIGKEIIEKPTPWERNNFEPIVWRKNITFTDSLIFIDTERGRSAARFVVLLERRQILAVMFITDLLDVLTTPGVQIHSGKVLTERWTFTKRGQNFGIRLAHKKDFEYIS